MTHHREKYPQDKYSIRPVTQPVDMASRTDPVLHAKEHGQPSNLHQTPHHGMYKQQDR